MILEGVITLGIRSACSSEPKAGTNPNSQLAASPLLQCKERNLHDSDFFNPSRLTETAILEELIRYLDQL